MAIYEITPSGIRQLPTTTFGSERLRERSDLQRLLRAQIDIISPDTLVITEEFGEWEDSRRRIDLLGLDKNANLVVIELKRTDDGGHMELQALRYAAMVSAMTFEKVVDVHTRYLTKLGEQRDASAAILDFLEWDEPDDDRFAQDVRVVLASGEFSKEITTAVMWLNDHGLDIRCIRLKPYSLDGRTLIDAQQIIPLPEAAEYQVQIREKEQRERKTRADRYDIRQRFWAALLDRSRTKTDLHGNISPSEYNWIGTSAGLRGLALNYTIRQHESVVELYIDRGDDAENKAIFDQLYAAKSEIETAFGGELSWQRLDLKRACRICKVLATGGYRDEANWPVIHDAMIDAMIRLDRAIRPRITELAAQNKS